ncbi:butyrate kinase [Clostridiales Family XIII bacterium PM5-7]
MPIRQLIINPGSTSTKLAIFEDDKKLAQETIDHANEALSAFETLPDQVPYRTEIVKDFLHRNNVALADLDGIMGRGGMVWGLSTGGYRINDDLVKALGDEELASQHASNLGGLIGKNLADEVGIPAFIYDPVTGASLPDIAKVTGFPEIVRQSCCHVLNSRAMAIQYAEENGLDYQKLNLIVAHMGGGISLSVHQNGTIIDSIGDDDGPFSPERAGGTQILEILKLCYSGENSYADMKKKCRGKGGLTAYLGTSDAREITKMIESGNEQAKLLFEAQAYQVAKAIGELSVVLKGNIDAIIMTGGLAHSTLLTGMIKEYIEFLAPVVIKPGENEMEALALGGMRLLKGEEIAKEFTL